MQFPSPLSSPPSDFARSANHNPDLTIHLRHRRIDSGGNSLPLGMRVVMSDHFQPTFTRGAVSLDQHSGINLKSMFRVRGNVFCGADLYHLCWHARAGDSIAPTSQQQTAAFEGMGVLRMSANRVEQRP
jgi:hypothetical protein